MAGGLNEEQAAVNTGILNVTLTLRGEFLAEVCRVLVLDIFDNGVPAVSIVSIYGSDDSHRSRTRLDSTHHRSLFTWSP